MSTLDYSVDPVFGPPVGCRACPRLAHHLDSVREKEPDWFNGPVPSFGDTRARLLIVGLAPGLKGANRTGRPFTGDYAGDLLYSTLRRFSFSVGEFDPNADDDLELDDVIITNAVRCLPPQNKPIGSEITNCRPYLAGLIDRLEHLRGILLLGRIAHDTTLTTLGLRRADYPFRHGAEHGVTDRITLFDSYHCSRYNTNTGRLTPEMFDAVFAQIRRRLDET